MEEKNILIIGIDFDLNYKTIPEGYKNFVSLLFDVNQASKRQLGYAMVLVTLLKNIQMIQKKEVQHHSVELQFLL
ncbi:hypothetical protein ONA22_05490 [Mycoplasmopsis cynos]|uniref:hypothetical protein n=1 Tax=Mycoplasmopsis cynos TaxID=171284 RepID=UPI0024C7F2BB|nr:hypothetical protein [Mycoplasmopsis cynos]WAM03187.1 hypothetical protein ONA22_05490 [Mycoplasmopsis cynos]